MIPISGLASQPITSPSVQTPERVQEARPAAVPAVSAPKPVQDEYIPEEKTPKSYGRYWPGKDENGSPKIFFDNPEAEEAPKAGEPEKAAPSGGKDEPEKCTCNTDEVDREIRKLREKQEKLEQQLASETDTVKARELERKLAQAENELRQKDNDSYRRQHAVFTDG